MSNNIASLARLIETATDDLTNARQILYELVDAISEGFVLYDADDRLVLCNQKFREIYAHSADLIVPGNSFEQIIRAGAKRGQYADAIGRIDEWVAERMRLHRNPSGAIEQRLGDGRWLRITECKTPSGWFAGLRVDITDLKHAEEAARRNEQRYRHLVERTNVIVYSYKVGERDLTYLAPQATKFLGYSLRDLASSEFWFKHMHPDDQPEVVLLGDAMAQCKQDHNVEYRMITADGSIVWVRDIVTFDTSQEGSLIAHGVIVDITDQKRSEAALRESEGRFRTMADTIPALLWLDDAAGKTIFVNKPWLDYTGRSFQEVLGDGWYNDIHPADREHVISAFAAACESHSEIMAEYRLLAQDGQSRWFLDTARPRFTPDGEYLGHIGILVDIDERRRLEARLAQAQKMEAVGQLTNGIAHDFNNLLTVVMGNARLLERALEDNERLHPKAAAISKAAGRGADLTHRLLAFSRQQALEPATVDIGELVEGMLDMLHRTLGETIEIKTSVIPNLYPAFVDANELEHAVLNLAVNARDAMPSGGTVIIEAVNATVTEQLGAQGISLPAGDYVEFSVSDTGTGIAKEHLDHIFEPFFTTKDVGKGTGLGLSMLYGFVNQSGGHVIVESEVGRGTTFRMYLPKANRVDGHVAGPEDPIDEHVSGDGTILVVEDEPEVRELAVSLLEGHGYRVIEAKSGPDAVSVLKAEEGVDLLFTDLVMPGGMSGQELAEEARRLQPRIKVLYTSGYNGEALTCAGTSAGPGDLITKPYRPAEMMCKVREILAG